jgi:hypothetical protein
LNKRFKELSSLAAGLGTEELYHNYEFQIKIGEIVLILRDRIEWCQTLKEWCHRWLCNKFQDEASGDQKLRFSIEAAAQVESTLKKIR